LAILAKPHFPKQSGRRTTQSFLEELHTAHPGGAAARVAATGPRLPLVWQAQCIEHAEGVAARVAAAGPRLPFV